MLVWKQCTRDITDRLIWRLKDSIIHLDEKGILLSGTKKNLLLSFSWQKSETREDLHGKWECHYCCWPSWPGALNEPHVQIPVWPLASMGTLGFVSFQYKGQWCDGHQWNSQNGRISASLGSWDREPFTIPAALYPDKQVFLLQRSNGHRTSLQVLQLQRCQTLPSGLPLENKLLWAWVISCNCREALFLPSPLWWIPC